MAKIYLCFGQPLFDKGLKENEQWAFNHEVSIETANIRSFNAVMNSLVKKNDDDDTYFDLCFICILNERVLLPQITFEHYIHRRTRYPKITIHGDHIKGLETNKEFFITDELVKRLGKYIEEDFDYEFIESKRVGKTVPSNNEVIYLLGGKPHIHHNGNFIEVSRSRPLKTKPIDLQEN